MKIRFKRNSINGITLVSLVITILVLLILASISIQILTGDNGIINNATNSKEQAIISHEKEILGLAVVQSEEETKYGSFTQDTLKNKIIENSDYSADNILVERKTSYSLVTFHSTGNSYIVYDNGTIEDPIVYDDVASMIGKTVSNYECLNGATGTNGEKVNWKIFYVDEDNNSQVYLIASDYVNYTSLPVAYYLNNSNVEQATTVKPNKGDTDFKASFTQVQKYYNTATPTSTTGYTGSYIGSARIAQYSLAIKNNVLTGWLGKYYTSLDGTISTNSNILSTAYMLDTTAWSKFKDSTNSNSKALYAIGGPTIEMFAASYNQSHNDSKVYTRSYNTGYSVSKYETSSFGYNLSLSSTDDLYDFYILTNSTYASRYWIASPSSYRSDLMVNIDCSGSITYGYWNFIGFRPVVCLKTGVMLEKQSNGTYLIKE